VGCEGSYKVSDDGEDRGLYETCRTCTKTEHVIYDELIGAENKSRETDDEKARFTDVIRLEDMNEPQRYSFWRDRLSTCIRCNACRNVCPVCNCKKCVFDSDTYDVKQKANSSSFEEQMFHIIRGYHVAGRCTDCGQCSRVCPAGIELYLLNRKIIKDINEMYGEFQAGENIDIPGPLTIYDKINDCSDAY